MPQTSHRHRKNWLILAALALLALIPFAIHHSGKDEAPITGSSSRKIAHPGTSLSTKPSRHGRQRATTQDLPTSHSIEDLDAFFLPPTNLSQVTLEEAMNTLLSHYRNICRETAEGPIQFHYTIHGEPDPIFYLKLGGDFISNCKFIAAMAGMTLEIENDQLIFIEVEDGPPVQRRWTVPPTFLEFVSDFYYGAAEPLEEGTIAPRISITGMLKGIGLIEDDEPVSFLGSSSTLIARAKPKNHVKVDGLVGKAIADTPFQTRIRFPDDSTPNLGMLIPPGGLGLLQKSGTSDGSTPDLQFLVASFERGFGRTLQTVSFTGELPSDEAQAHFLETGNVSALGIRENLSHATFNITRQSYEEKTHSFRYKDKDGKSHELPFVSDRMDASGKTIEIPPLKAE